jgi:hypothetical protein
MKKIILLHIMAAFLFFAQAQSISSMTNENFTFSTGQLEVTKVAFKDVSAKQVEKAFNDFFKETYKAKVNGVKKVAGEYTIEEFKPNDIQQKPTTVVAKIVELEGNGILYIHYNSNGYVVSEKNTPDIFPGYKNMTQKVANKALSLAFNEKLEANTKTLATQEKELSDFVKNEEKQKEAIAKAQTEIKTSETAVSTLTSDLDKQKAVVAEKLKLVEAKKQEIATVDVKSLEKSIKDVEADTKKADGEIAKFNADIAKKESEIAKLQAEISTIKTEIETVNQRKEANSQKIADIQKQITEFNADALKEQLKLLEKDNKDAESVEKDIAKNIEKEKSSIVKNNENIKSSEAEIATLKTSQETKKAEIAKTQTLVKSIQAEIAKLK